MRRRPLRHAPKTVAPLGRVAARAVVWLVIAALLNVLAVPMPPDLGTDTTGPESLVVTICTQLGPQQVHLGADDQAAPVRQYPGNTPHSGHICPFCAVQAGAALPPHPVAMPLPPMAVASAIAPLPLLDGQSAVLWFLDGRPTRAPPLA